MARKKKTAPKLVSKKASRATSAKKATCTMPTASSTSAFRYYSENDGERQAAALVFRRASKTAKPAKKRAT